MRNSDALPTRGVGGSRRRVASITALSGLILGLAAIGATERANAGFQPIQGCTYRANVSAIIDDSGSTSSTDPAKLRAAALRYFISRQLNAKGFPARKLSAVEFGDDASVVFGPTEINEANRAAMDAALDADIDADDGRTDYDAAFFYDSVINIDHDARIFFTDGRHNEGAYDNLHRPGPKTHVLGLDVSDSDLLDRIARETGGFHIPLDEASEVPIQMERVFADLSCIEQPVQRTFTAPDPGEKRTVLKSQVKKSDSTLSLAIFTGDTPSGDFQIRIKDRNNARHKVNSKFDEAQLSKKGEGCRTKAKKGKKKGKKRKPKLKIRCSADPSFHLLELTGRKGKSARKALGKRLKVKVKTDKDAFTFGAELTASLTRSG